MLSLHHVGRRFPNGVEALRDVTLRLAERDFIALLGASGCGKSTLLRLIAGLETPDAGELVWDDHPVAHGKSACRDGNSGNTGTGNDGHGNIGPGIIGPGETGPGETASGNTGPGNNGPENTKGGNTGGGNTGGGNGRRGNTSGENDGPGDIGYVFQDATLLPWATAEDNVYLPLRLRGLARRAAMPQVHAALHRVGLAGFETTQPRGLSGGMRMRVSIARALVTRPRLLLMDEPFAALDEFTRHSLQADLLEVWRQAGCTVVFVTHSIYEAAFLARRIVLMTPRPGRIAGVIDSPLTPGPEARLDPAYAALTREVAQAMQQAMACGG